MQGVKDEKMKDGVFCPWWIQSGKGDELAGAIVNVIWSPVSCGYVEGKMVNVQLWREMTGIRVNFSRRKDNQSEWCKWWVKLGSILEKAVHHSKMCNTDF